MAEYRIDRLEAAGHILASADATCAAMRMLTRWPTRGQRRGPDCAWVAAVYF
jgi:hypothetical protein